MKNLLIFFSIIFFFSACNKTIIVVEPKQVNYDRVEREVGEVKYEDDSRHALYEWGAYYQEAEGTTELVVADSVDRLIHFEAIVRDLDTGEQYIFTHPDQYLNLFRVVISRVNDWSPIKVLSVTLKKTDKRYDAWVICRYTKL